MRRLISLLAFIAVVVPGSVVLMSHQDPAHAWKPPSHLFGVEGAILDVQDGTVAIPDGSGGVDAAAVNPTIRAAVEAYPEYYRAGAVGPDAFPDTLFGQAQIHPDTRTHNDEGPVDDTDTAQTHEWLRYLWEQAWDPSQDPTARLQNIAFALGYMGGHANGDVWAHTWVNSYAGGVFPDFTDLEHSDISVRHVVIEGYVDKHRPGFEDKTGYALKAPTSWVADKLILSDFARSRSESPVYDMFFGLQDGLVDLEAPLHHDNTTQDELCGTVAGVTVCVPDPTDSPVNLIEWGIDSLIEAYLDAWIEDIDRGLRDWVKVWEVIAQEMFSGKKPNTDAILDAMSAWIYKDLLSMLGLPDFVGDGLFLVSEVTTFIAEAISGALRAVLAAVEAVPVIGDAVKFLHTLLSKARDDVIAAATDVVDAVAGVFITAALGFTNLNASTRDAIDRDDDGQIRPSEVIRVFQEPEEYISHPALFTPQARSLIDADMHLGPGADRDEPADGQDESFRDYDINRFAPLTDTLTMAKLAMLDEHGLNDLFKDVVGGRTSVLNPLYRAHPNSSGSWAVPNNVMLGWAKSIDAEYQWRTHSPRDGRSYGTGELWLFEDCLSRHRLFSKVFLPPVAGVDAFGDAGDPPTGRTDSAAPTSTLDVSGPTATSGGSTYVSGATQLAIRATDNYFDNGELKQFRRVFDPATAAPSYDAGLGDADAFSLSGADGTRRVQFYAVDDAGRCNTEAVQSRDFTLDNTPPTITVASPAAPGPADYLSDQLLPLTFTADDGAGSGVDAASARHFVDDVSQPGPPGQVDLFDYPAGTHVYRAEQADALGNLGTTSVPWRTTVTHESLQNNLTKAYVDRGCIADASTEHSLRVKLTNAHAADLRGNDNSSDNQLQAFIDEVLHRTGYPDQNGKTITTYCSAILTTNAAALQQAA